MNETQSAQLRRIPKMDSLLSSDGARALSAAYAPELVREAMRDTLDELRTKIRGASIDELELHRDAIVANAASKLAELSAPRLRRVVNATGIVLHTNLGRAPLAPDAIAAIEETASGYSNLEYTLDTGKRGSRYEHVEEILCALTGAEAAVVVNNNAAAVMVVLKALAEGGDVIVSRGELIEIGGSFRIPDVVASSNARLVEVGTTNKTKIRDYERAISDSTRALMKVHPSNYRIVGFTAETSREELVALGREHELPVVEDLGSGSLVDLRERGLPHEATVQEVVASGVDVVTFSGDKLLGGPQAGIVVGRRAYVDAVKRNPLIRAVRIDKLSLAALEATLQLYRRGNVFDSIPALRMMAESTDEMRARAQKIHDELAGVSGVAVSIGDDEGYAGGGSLPAETIPTCVVRVTCSGHSPDALSAALREFDPPIVARIADDTVVLDMRTVSQDDVRAIVDALRALGR